MKYSTSTKAFKLAGVPELRKTLLAMAKNLSEEGEKQYLQMVQQAMLKPAQMIRDDAKDMVPVVTGKLHDAIFAVPMKEKPGALAGVNVKKVHYAPMVEYGTSKMAAQPYLRPAIQATRPLAAVIIAGDVKKIIDVVAKDNAYHASKET